MPRAWMLALGLAVAVAAVAEDAPAADEACFQSYTEAQARRRKNELARAKESLKACLAPSCPALLRTDCQAWLAEIEAETPSIAIDTDAPPGPSAVTVDGRSVTLHEDVVLDPGPHRIRVETARGAREVTIELHKGEKKRRVLVSFAEAVRPAPPTVTTRPLPAGFWIASAVSVLALGTFGVAGGIGLQDQSSLEDRCAPRCPPEDSARVSRAFLVADVALGVSVVAATTALVFLFTRPNVTTTASAK